MFTYLKIRNFQSLIDISVDFMKTNTKPKKLIVVYGENGIGKTNFANVFYMLQESFRTMITRDILKMIMDKEIKNDLEHDLINLWKEHYSDTTNIIKKYKTIDSSESMRVEFGFIDKGKKGIYIIEYDNFEITYEKLDYVFNKNTVCFFELSNNKMKINDKIFSNRDYYKQFQDLLEKYWGKHSFFSILSFEKDDKKKAYIKKNISNNLINVYNSLLNFSIKVKNKKNEYGVIGVKDLIFNNLYYGEIPFNKKEVLYKTEEMLNTFFTNLYSDIKRVFYKTEEVNNKIKYELFVKKLLYGTLKDIKFSLESTGTQNLLELIPYIISAFNGGTVIIDEFDSGIHDILVNNILHNIKPHLKGQLIITTHNTLILENTLKKEDIYLFKVNHEAKKELFSLTEFGERNHKNLNMRKRYLSGLYGGVPFTKDMDFNDVFNSLKD